MQDQNVMSADQLPVGTKSECRSLSLRERLALIALIEEGAGPGTDRAPVISELFENVTDLLGATVRGSRIDRLKPYQNRPGFQAIEITSETGDQLGHLNMLYLNKPIPCYYLVYVEVLPPYRQHGLGHRILNHFNAFLEQKGALGLLDNIIPPQDPTFDLYNKHHWLPAESLTKGLQTAGQGLYMIYVPRRLRGRDLREPVNRLLHHLKRRRAVIDMRDNESMVRQTIAEFKDLYAALLLYFDAEIKSGRQTGLMRYMFTRYVTKLIAFRRRIGELLGYTGGESTEQLGLNPEVSSLPMQSYPPPELAGETSVVLDDGDILAQLPEALIHEPPRFIEKLPNYRRPSLSSWLARNGKDISDTFTIGDLMDMGFDPTRLKEIDINGTPYIFERMQARKLSHIRCKSDFLRRMERDMAGSKANRADVFMNPPLLIIQNIGNAYVLRRKVDGIHWEEASSEIKRDPALKSMDELMNLDRLVKTTVWKTHELIHRKTEYSVEELRDCLTCFVSWQIETNQPGLVADFTTTYLQSIWVA